MMLQGQGGAVATWLRRRRHTHRRCQSMCPPSRDDEHGFREGPGASNALELRYLEASSLKAAGQGCTGEESNVSAFWVEVPIEIQATYEQVLQPAVIRSRQNEESP